MAGPSLPKKLRTQGDLTCGARFRGAAPLKAPELTDTFARARDCEAFVVKKLTNEHRKLDVLSTVLAVGASGLLRPQRRKLGLPVAKRVGLHTDDIRHFSDLEEELVWKLCAPRHDQLRWLRPHRRSSDAG